MEASGVLVALLNVPAGLTEEFNRWYDLDHLPEHIAKRDVLTAHRYVAPAPLRAEPGILAADLLGGYAPYLTTYFIGGPDDVMAQEVRAGWLDLDRGLRKAGRFWRNGDSPYARRWRIASAQTRPDCRVRQAAVPYLAHTGLILALGRAPSTDRFEEAAAWWDAVHLPDLFAVAGVLGAVRLALPDGAPSDLLAHLLLCDQAPELVLRGIREAKRYWEAVGRFPAFGGVYEDLAFLPYRRIVPLEYDFEVDDAG